MANQNLVIDPSTGAVTGQNIVKQGMGVPSGGSSYYGVPGGNWWGLTTVALTANQVRYTPIWVPYPVTITDWLLEVTTGPSGTGNLRVGIYAADASLQPTGAATYDSGAVAVASAFTGTKSASGLSVSLTPGKYLVGLNVSNAMTLRHTQGNSSMILSTMGTPSIPIAFTGSQTFGAFPSPGTAWTGAPVVSAQGWNYGVFFKWTE